MTNGAAMRLPTVCLDQFGRTPTAGPRRAKKNAVRKFGALSKMPKEFQDAAIAWAELGIELKRQREE